jgi:hypothetical protein
VSKKATWRDTHREQHAASVRKSARAHAEAVKPSQAKWKAANQDIIKQTSIKVSAIGMAAVMPVGGSQVVRSSTGTCGR